MLFFLLQSFMFWVSFEGAIFSKVDGRDLPPYNILLLSYLLSLLFKGAYAPYSPLIYVGVGVCLSLHLWGRVPDWIVGLAVAGLSFLFPSQAADSRVLIGCGVVLFFTLFIKGVSASVPFFVLSFLLGFTDTVVLTISLLVITVFRGVVFKVFVKSAYPKAVWFISYVLISVVLYGASLVLPLFVIVAGVLSAYIANRTLLS